MAVKDTKRRKRKKDVDSNEIITLENVSKAYSTGAPALNGISLHINRGEFVFIVGDSGSGKSTLLNCIGGLDIADSGSIVVDGTEIVGMKQDMLSEYRRDKLGFIFQFYNLIPNLTVKENIQVCEYLTKTPLDLDDLLETLGLTAHQNKFPSQLSGGQQQRGAI